MRIEPSVILGPKICPKCEGKFCDHERTMQYIGIYWQSDDGQEWGQAAIASLHDGEISEPMRDALERQLWKEYARWVEDEGKDEAGALDSTC